MQGDAKRTSRMVPTVFQCTGCRQTRPTQPSGALHFSHLGQEAGCGRTDGPRMADFRRCRELASYPKGNADVPHRQGCRQAQDAREVPQGAIFFDPGSLAYPILKTHAGARLDSIRQGVKLCSAKTLKSPAWYYILTVWKLRGI